MSEPQVLDREIDENAAVGFPNPNFLLNPNYPHMDNNSKYRKAYVVQPVNPEDTKNYGYERSSLTEHVAPKILYEPSSRMTLYLSKMDQSNFVVNNLR